MATKRNQKDAEMALKKIWLLAALALEEASYPQGQTSKADIGLEALGKIADIVDEYELKDI